MPGQMDPFEKRQLVEDVEEVVVAELTANYRRLLPDEADGVEHGLRGLLQAAENPDTSPEQLATILHYGEVIVAAVENNPTRQQQGPISG